MSQLAAGLKLITDNGRERRTDGLMKHLGVAEVDSLRAVGNQAGYLQHGAGLELRFDPTAPTGAILPYDRDKSQYLDLHIQGKNIYLEPVGGTLSLPTNIIGTSHIQANAVNQVVGQFGPGGSGFVCTTAPWVETDIRVTATFTGAPVRVDYNIAFVNSTLGALNYIGIGFDGAAGYNLAQISTTGVNYGLAFSGSMYYTVTPGVHRISLFVGVSGGQMTLQSAVNQYLFLTEMKR